MRKNSSPIRRPRVLLIVTGSVAAYKSAALLKLLRPRYDVRVAATKAALRLVRRSELARAAGSPVGIDAFRGVKPLPVSTPPGSRPLVPVPHIEFARDCDLVLVAPATADFLAKMALGLADDLASSCCLYSRAPVMAAPAMNSAMWQHPAVVANVDTLRRRGAVIIGPGDGHLACGDEGKGRMSEPAEIARTVDRHFERRSSWAGLSVLVTAGPTQEPLDPVRVLTNHSSGRMGYALARAALARGARVALVSGPVALGTPAGARRIDVRTALEMHRAVMRELPGKDLVVMAAAVADFRPHAPSSRKVKKRGAGLALRLERNPDILADVLARRGRDTVVMGFAAETQDLEREARAKWRRKPCDLLVANLVGEPSPDGSGTGAGALDNEALVFVRGKKAPLRMGRESKEALAERLMDLVEREWSLSGRAAR